MNLHSTSRFKSWIAVILLAVGLVFVSGFDNLQTFIKSVQGAESTQSAARSTSSLSEEEARKILDSIYKGDYRNAFIQKDPELFLKHISDDFQSVSAEGNEIDAKSLREFFTQRFKNLERTIEHNVTIEDIDILPDNKVAAVVTLNTLEEFRKMNGDGNYLVTTVATYRDVWQKRGDTWFEISGDQLRNQVITAPRP